MPRSSRRDCPGCVRRRPRCCVVPPWHSPQSPRPHSATGLRVQRLHCRRSCSADSSSTGSSPDSDPTPASHPEDSTHPDRRETCSIAVAAPPCRQSDCETADCACPNTPPCAPRRARCSPRSAPALPQNLLLQGMPQLVDELQDPLFNLLKGAFAQVQTLGKFLDQDLAARQNVSDFHGLSPLPNKDQQGGDRPFSSKTQCRKTRS